ncbi:MAG: hypothetical protein WC551_13145 [Patescibacteria group bacterium]
MVHIGRSLIEGLASTLIPSTALATAAISPRSPSALVDSGFVSAPLATTVRSADPLARSARLFAEYGPTQDLRHLQWTDEELFELHESRQLAAAVDFRGIFDPARIVVENVSMRSRYEIMALYSILGKRCRFSRGVFLQVPRELESLRDRLYYLLLAGLDRSAARGEVSKSDYDIGRRQSELCFCDRDGCMVALIPGSVFYDDDFPSSVPMPDTSRPEIEVAAMIPGDEVAVLDAGIGNSTLIRLVSKRLRELGKSVRAFGIGLAEPTVDLNLSQPAFVGPFEDYDFPQSFDLVYSQISSAYYTLNVPRYLRKLCSILSPDGLALLWVYDYPKWERALHDLHVDFTPLYNIQHLAWLADAQLNPDSLLTEEEKENAKQPTGVLVEV